MNKHLVFKLGLGLTCLFTLIACTKTKKGDDKGTAPEKAEIQNLSAEIQSLESYKLPEGMTWETNLDDPVYSDPKAKKGGTLRVPLSSYPMTFRTVGPDSNSGIRGVTLALYMSLVEMHPNTGKTIPLLASHWALAKDKVTVYYKLDPRAKWSDGRTVTADDFTFMYDFMRSKDIVAPWYNRYYTEKIKSVKKHHTFVVSVTYHVPLPPEDLIRHTNLGPLPKQFFKLGKDFVKKYNWEYPPTVGPYDLASFKRGKNIVFKRKKDWWGLEDKYLKNRFNVDKVKFVVVRDINQQWERFLKGEFDSFGLTLPQYWHEKSAQREEYKNGYITKLWFYNDIERSPYFMALNLKDPMWEDKKIRYAFAHSIHIEKVLKTILRGDYERLENFSTGHGKYDRTDIKARRFDVEKVKQLMTEAGYKRGSDGIWEKNGKKFAVRLTHGMAWHDDRMVILKEEAKKAGLDLQIQKMDPSASFKSFLEKKHQVAYLGLSTNLVPAYWQMFHSDNAFKPQTNNFCNMSDKAMDKEIEAYRGALTVDDRVKHSHKIQQLIHDSGCIVPTYLVPYFRTSYWNYWRLPNPPATKRSESAFSAFSTHEGGLFWLDEELKEKTLAAKKAGKKLEPKVLIDKTYYRK